MKTFGLATLAFFLGFGVVMGFGFGLRFLIVAHAHGGC